MYDIETGEKLTRGGRPQRRQAGHATPCHKCPKGSPENESRVVLSPHNKQAFAQYLVTRAGVIPETWKLDATFRHNCAIISRVYEHWQASQATTDLSQTLAQLFREGKP